MGRVRTEAMILFFSRPFPYFKAETEESGINSSSHCNGELRQRSKRPIEEKRVLKASGRDIVEAPVFALSKRMKG
jgi:hypothetical protein